MEIGLEIIMNKKNKFRIKWIINGYSSLEQAKAAIGSLRYATDHNNNYEILEEETGKVVYDSRE